MFDALESQLTSEERPLVELLFLEVTSSQLSGVASLSSPAANRLLSPPRRVQTSTRAKAPVARYSLKERAK